MTYKIIDVEYWTRIVHLLKTSLFLASCQVDEELVAILLSLSEDPNNSKPQECSPTANTSQSEKTLIIQFPHNLFS